MKKIGLKKILIFAALVIVVVAAATSGAVADRLFGFKLLDKFFPKLSGVVQERIVTESSDVVEVVKKVGPSVVTVSATAPVRQIIQFSPFSGFTSGTQGGKEQDIGSGFVVSSDGLIITNKHVVADAALSYKVSTSDGKTYDVGQISRDPNNDIAVIKIDASGLTPVDLGDSSNLQVGQFVIAIGTALGEFRNTVTTGVISGLGRGIDAGSSFQGYVERLDNVIQTDAAINPGNSGGPLLNSAGQVIGINVAVAEGANNIAFSIPINTVKEALNVFKTTGKFPAKAYLGVGYQVISQQIALLNQVPQGMYVVNVVSGSPAEKAGIQVGDIIFKIDGNTVGDNSEALSTIISGKKPGDTISLDIWRNGETKNINVTLTEIVQ
ncbi:MAG: protease Do [uncultured bacterium]|uniref:Protease DegQ n=1 Tax=Candidatus Woesebacteria bacterium GW2011_GWA1_40_43 TaxID=1618553 RepID=A0A0G0SHD1_9BACT|nr:MAG: protease Do [uncultured bacterium]KKR54276.1 MAG: Protease DegQ [Candidatus Woesebacteria bacterium GW2011_GWD2_40_19]KKR56985.1 MAG: Protease DegQ [Candidatus Woesebacteria bacterium GW2011_GWC2_40_30]KKR64199.1 MAG: Protease DegQ [Candidatus Woesebacteria bacterium GW2011_GWA1_40_43]HAU65581.1 serine protease [Candidatus Woesebacteria bacterium]